MSSHRRLEFVTVMVHEHVCAERYGDVVLRMYRVWSFCIPVYRVNHCSVLVPRNGLIKVSSFMGIISHDI